ncbi:hypothetical protein CFELI_12900 [Corynebacterium felinum]|nr:hypothetical protein CFELI_12900 [Corynebacterium felinum]
MPLVVREGWGKQLGVVVLVVMAGCGLGLVWLHVVAVKVVQVGQEIEWLLWVS